MSAKYRIFETTRFAKDLRIMVGGALPKLEEKLRNYIYPQLKQSPHVGPNIKRLKGYDPSTWRYRVGDWRFFYEIDDNKKIVFMTAAHHRSQAYK